MPHARHQTRTCLKDPTSATDSALPIDAVTGEAVNNPLPIGALAPQGITFDGTYLWTANSGSANVCRLVP